MDWLHVGLRVVHIFSGVAWVGGAALFFLYLEPAINKLGPDAEKFVDELVNRRRVPIYFVTVSTLTVLAGLWLYWRDTNGLDMTAVTSPAGLAFGLGGLAAVVAWAGSNLLIPGTLKRLSEMGTEMKASAGAPPAELVGRMHATQERLRLIGLVDLILLGLAVLAMAVARYLG